ncbi:MAG: hypothetical protein F4Z14_07575 [Gammaproteobacteria bacterium]|nr:hypothetical protein [Gammaproteobacteria bacterium]
MLRPAIFIGCGGSGTKAVRYVRDAVQRRLDHRGWEGGIPDAWQFIGLDTLAIQEDPTEIPEMPAADFLSISGTYVRYSDLYEALIRKYSTEGPVPKSRPLCGWLPDPRTAKIPLKTAAGQNRGIGRAAGLLSLEGAVLDRLSEAFLSTAAGGPQLHEVATCLGVESELGGATPEPLVVVVSSMAGGTGAGVVLDVVDLVRACDPRGGYPALVLFTNDIFDVTNSGSMAANSLGLMSEMLAAYWSKPGEIESPLRTKAVTEPGVGPHAVFFVGRYSYSGADLGDTAEVYRATGEALSTWVADGVVQEQIQDFVKGNWQRLAKDNHGGYPFAREQLSGAASSFGAAKITVGRDRFSLWAERLLARQVLESLSEGHLRLSPLSDRSADDPEKEQIETLGRHYADRIHRGATSGGNAARGFPSAAEHFAAAKAVRNVRDQVVEALQFPAGQEAPGDQWERRLKAEGGRLADEWAAKADVPPDGQWCHKMVEATCRATSAVAALSSLSVAAAALSHVAEKINPAEVNSIRTTAAKAEEAYKTEVKRGLDAVRVDSQLRGDSDEVRSAAESIAQGVAQRWRAKRLEHAADTMEAAGEQVFGAVRRAVQAAQQEVGQALDEDSVKAWPSSINDLSGRYLPSTVEFPLELHDNWPALLSDLCGEARIDGVPYGNLTTDALRYRLIAGDSDMAPLVRPGEHHRWQPGQHADVVCDAGEDDIEKRVHEWTRRPGERFNRTVSEGLRSYLAEEDGTGRKRADHPLRMMNFREQLGNAKQAADPLVWIDDALYGMTNSESLEPFKTVCSQFPFGEGHPARKAARDVLGTDASYSASVQDSSSVLVSSYVNHPIYPMAVRSFAGPVAEALQNSGGPEERSSKFWMWSRGRTLEAFVPLPREALEAMASGFAVARLCGYITAVPTAAIRITASSDGEREFPWPLLTILEDWDDLLAALLESFCLTFGMVGGAGMGVYDSYERLYDLGQPTRHGRITPDLSQLLATGDPPHPTVAEETPKATGGSVAERRRAALGYLDANLGRFRTHEKMDRHMVRRIDGSAEPGAMTTELAPIFLRCYGDLRDLIAGKQQTGSVT